MRFIKWLSSLWPKRQKVILRVPLRKGMNLSKWRESPDLIRGARQLWKNGVFLDMIAVLKNNTPAREVSIQTATEVNSLIELGRIRGYEQAVELLENLADYPTQPVKDIETDWGASEIMARDNYPMNSNVVSDGPVDPIYDDQD